MKYYAIALLLTLCFFCAPSGAQQTYSSTRTYQLHRLEIADTQPSQSIWFVEGSPPYGFNTLEAPTLRTWVATLPQGTEIDYHSPTEGVPIIGKIRDLDANYRKTVASFADYCSKHGVRFADNFPVL